MLSEANLKIKDELNSRKTQILGAGAANLLRKRSAQSVKREKEYEKDLVVSEFEDNEDSTIFGLNVDQHTSSKR